MFFEDSSTAGFDGGDCCMAEDVDLSTGEESNSPPPNFYPGLPSSPNDDDDTCYVVVEEQRHHMHSITCSPASSSSASSSSSTTSPPVVRAFSTPPRRVSWREHMRDLHRATITESIQRLSSMRGGGVEKKRRGKGGGQVGPGGRRFHRPSCAEHIWSLVQKQLNKQPCPCACSSEPSGISDNLIDRLRRLTRFDNHTAELTGPAHRFTYSYKLDFTLPTISEEGGAAGCSSSGAIESSGCTEAAAAAAARLAARSCSRPTLGRISRSASPSPSRPHCPSPAAEEQLLLQHLQLQPPVISEEEMCARLSALPIGYHATATVAALESALHASLSLMDTDAGPGAGAET